MANQIILNSFTSEQFKELFKEAFQEIIISNPNAIGGGSIGGEDFTIDSKGNVKKAKDTTKYLTRQQVAKLLQISLPTLQQYTKAGVLTSYRIGNKGVRYKATEIETALRERSYQFRRKGGCNE